MLHAAMGKSPAMRGGRYDMRKITAEVEQIRHRLGFSKKEAALGSGMSESQWSQKIRLVINSFSIHELGRIADCFDAPLGWPFIDWELAERHFGRPSVGRHHATTPKNNEK
jgi:hypothetical protein